MSRYKLHPRDLRKRSTDELNKLLGQLDGDLRTLNGRRAQGSLMELTAQKLVGTDIAKYQNARKNVARIKTILRERVVNG